MTAWVVDTCVVLDVFENDPQFGLTSARLLERLLPEGLVASPVTVIELGAAFDGDLAEEKRFFDKAGISFTDPWTSADTEAAHAAWSAYVAAKRSGRERKRAIADIMIGAFASNRRGLVTRNAPDFKKWFPGLKLVGG